MWVFKGVRILIVHPLNVPGLTGWGGGGCLGVEGVGWGGGGGGGGRGGGVESGGSKGGG